MTTPSDETVPSLDEKKKDAIRINIHVNPRMFALPAFGAFTGLALGLIRGSRDANLQFLAENAHKQPRTVRGWYFYNKTKNYRMMLAGLRAGGKDAVKIGSVGLLWAGIEEAVIRLTPILEPGKEVIAGIGTAVAFSMVTKLGMRTGWKAVTLGATVGAIMSQLRLVRWRLEEEARRRREEPS